MQDKRVRPGVSDYARETVETLRFVESRINLEKGRGRVRRIALRDEDGQQINLLASSTYPAAIDDLRPPVPTKARVGHTDLAGNVSRLCATP